MKLIVCKSCGPKPVKEFAKHWRKGYQNNCRKCRAKYNRKHYINNKRTYLQNALERRTRLKKELRTKMLEYLHTRACEACGEADPVVLDFHHRKGTKKTFTIAWAMSNRIPWSRILKEITKCQILCANDHRRAHARTQKTYKFLGR